jgi:hypothetical protein
LTIGPIIAWASEINLCCFPESQCNFQTFLTNRSHKTVTSSTPYSVPNDQGPHRRTPKPRPEIGSPDQPPTPPIYIVNVGGGANPEFSRPAMWAQAVRNATQMVDSFHYRKQMCTSLANNITLYVHGQMLLRFRQRHLFACKTF